MRRVSVGGYKILIIVRGRSSNFCLNYAPYNNSVEQDKLMNTHRSCHNPHR